MPQCKDMIFHDEIMDMFIQWCKDSTPKQFEALLAAAKPSIKPSNNFIIDTDTTRFPELPKVVPEIFNSRFSKISYLDCTHVDHHIDPKLLEEIDRAFHERLLINIDSYLNGAMTMTATSTTWRDSK